MPGGAVRDRPLRQHAGPHQLRRPVDVAAPPSGRAVGVGEEGVQRAVALLDTGRDPCPLGGRDDPRDRVQRERLHGLPAVRPRRDGHPPGRPLDGHRGRGGGQALDAQPFEGSGHARVVVAQPAVREDRLVGGGCGIAGEERPAHSQRSNQAATRSVSSTRRSRPTTVCPSPGQQQQLAGRAEGLQLLVGLHRLSDGHVRVPVAVSQQHRRGQPVRGRSSARGRRAARGR